MPAGFTNLVTTLKASDYDYIIFDMPPVTPISATPRLGSYMDMVLFVVESGRTTRQLGAQAGALLAEARANALVVLNKCRQHVPPALAQDT
jgi:Mrp family chromosome partitioning ATPase